MQRPRTDSVLDPRADDTVHHQTLRRLLTGYWVSQSIYVVAKVGVADHLAEGPRDIDALAARVEADPGALRRIMAVLTAAGLFAIDEAGRYTLTASGQYLRAGQPGSLRALALWNGEVSYPIWAHALQAVRTGRPASDRTFGMQQFHFLARNPEAAAIFNQAMAGLAVHLATAVVANYDFSRLRRVVDVGGGQGTLIAAILRHNPALRGVVLESPAVCEAASRHLAAAGLSDRCDVVAGDFFEAVPRGGDAYILSSVVHDWDDERSIVILRNCRRAMSDAARLLLVECVLPAGAPVGGPAFSQLLDLQMLVMTGGRERSEAEYRTLLAAAGLRMSGVIATDCPESILEAEPVR
jgi:hypothetical protein